MRKCLALLQLRFLPESKDAALLLLRTWLSLSLLSLHGWSKLTGFEKKAGAFPDPIGLGSETSLVLAIFTEVACSVFILLGCFARLATLNWIIMFLVAFFLVHGGALTGENSGELAFIYLAGASALFIAGPGRFSIDAYLQRSKAV